MPSRPDAPCCASPAPTLSSDSHARPLLPLTAPWPPGVRDRLSPHVLRSLERRPSGLHPFLRCPSSARLIFLPPSSREITALSASSPVRAFDGAPPPTMPSADFCAAIRSPCDDLSLESGTTTQTSRGKTNRNRYGALRYRRHRAAGEPRHPDGAGCEAGD